jgi:hypothetical protein
MPVTPPADWPESRVERVRGFAARLADNAERAATEHARIEAVVLAARERGVDTSTFDARTSAKSPDQSLGQAEARMLTAQRNYDAYISRYPWAAAS